MKYYPLLRFSFVLFFLLSTLNLNAAIRKSVYNKKSLSIDKYELVDIEFKTRSKIQAPFEVQFDAVFTSPKGKTQRVPAFFNGDGRWIVRFSAGETGEWHYTTQSEIKAFNNKKGTISISNTNYKNRKGMIVKSKEYPKNFFWEDGSPYFLMAFEFDFMFALDYQNKQGTPRLNHFLDKVAENGFNQIVMNVYANDVVWAKDPKLKASPQYEFGDDEKIFPFMGSNRKPDHSTLNVEFFQKFDRTMEALNDRNIVSHLMIYVWNKAVAWAKYGSKEDNRYFDYVVKRYQAFSNIIWDVSKEAILYGNVKDDYILGRIDRIKELDSFGRLVTVHDAGFCNRNKESVDFFSRQDWKLSVHEEMMKSYNTFTDKPVFNIEHGGYEKSDFHVFCGNYDNAEYCLRRNYESLFAGVYSTYYWQGCSWNVIIYDWDTNKEVLYKPKFEYFKHMTDFFTEHEFHTFKPEPRYSNSSFCMTNGKGRYLFYMPKESYRNAMGKLTEGKKSFKYRWFNTKTGEYSKLVETKTLNMFNAPSPVWYLESDAILILDVEEK